MEHHPATLSEMSTKCEVELSGVGGEGSISFTHEAGQPYQRKRGFG